MSLEKFQSIEQLKLKLHSLLNRDFPIKKHKLLELQQTEAKLAESYFQQPGTQIETGQGLQVNPQMFQSLEPYVTNHGYVSKIAYSHIPPVTQTIQKHPIIFNYQIIYRCKCRTSLLLTAVIQTTPNKWQARQTLQGFPANPQSKRCHLMRC